MKKNLMAAAAALAFAATAPAANALVWTTQLEYDGTGKISSLGVVTVTDGLNEGKDVLVQLDLDQGFVVDTGGHYAFAFNLMNDPGNQILNIQPAPDGPGGAVDYIYANTWSNTTTTTETHNVCTGQGRNRVCTPVTTTTTHTDTDPPPYMMSPFGEFNNAFFLNPNGGNHLAPPHFEFTVRNEGGLTFAGTGIVPGPGGLLVPPLGDGLHFFSNSNGSVPGAGPGGWWFAVDTSGTDSNYSPTGVIAGRDAITSVPGVPEPATWALMITGFGAAGAMLRRRRAMVA